MHALSIAYLPPAPWLHTLLLPPLGQVYAACEAPKKTLSKVMADCDGTWKAKVSWGSCCNVGPGVLCGAVAAAWGVGGGVACHARGEAVRGSRGEQGTRAFTDSSGTAGVEHAASQPGLEPSSCRPPPGGAHARAAGGLLPGQPVLALCPLIIQPHLTTGGQESCCLHKQGAIISKWHVGCQRT